MENTKLIILETETYQTLKKFLRYMKSDSYWQNDFGGDVKTPDDEIYNYKNNF